MRKLLLFVFLGCVLTVVVSRPSHFHAEEREEAEYENEIEGDDAVEEEEDSAMDAQDQESAAEEQDEEPQQSDREREVNRNAYAQRSAENHALEAGNNNYQNLHAGRNFALEEESDKSNENTEYQPSAASRDTKKLAAKNENADQSDPINNFFSPESNKVRMQKNALDKRNLDEANNEGGNILFESFGPVEEKINRREFKAAESQEQMRYPRKENTADIHVSRDRSEHSVYSNRERRALQESINDTMATTILAGNTENGPEEDEEAAIKRHVKTLSVEELNTFMNSLSHDKRELLKKIMNNDDSVDIKREITKKTGPAVDESSYLDGGAEHSESGKVENESITTTAPEVSVVSKEAKSSTAHVGTSPIILYKEGNDSSSIIDKKSDEADITAKSAMPESSDEVKIVAAQEPSKSESKRDVSAELESVEEDDPELEEDLNAKDLQDLSNEPGHYYQSKEIVDESPQPDAYNNMEKREAHDDNDLKKSIKSLEESFPNSNSYEDDDPYLGSDMAPLVRVKRNNMNLPMKKRAAGILPEARVGFCPYRAESDDEDNEEGNEFYDDGFYDRASNLAQNKEENLEDNPAQLKADSDLNQPNNMNMAKLSETLNLQNDKTKLGSDSDNVVTGVEGADENLMFDSASRNKRTIDEYKLGEAAGLSPKSKLNRLARSTPLSEDDANSKPDNNAPLYNENDAFGALSRTYDGGRYKRIRRVKQPSLVESEAPSSN